MIDYHLLEEELIRTKALLREGNCPIVFVEEKLRGIARVLEVKFIREKETNFWSEFPTGVMDEEDLEYNFRYIERVLEQRKKASFPSKYF